MDDNDNDFNDNTNEGNFNIFFSVFSKYLEWPFQNFIDPARQNLTDQNPGNCNIFVGILRFWNNFYNYYSRLYFFTTTTNANITGKHFSWHR